ncbi:MAG: helix-turn-helix domain-containing protein [Myxococcota bacterium]
MKPIADQDHYEVLEVPRNATREEIERAYRLACATYADDSLAGYSVFGEGDAEAVRQQIETAFRVLSSDESRQADAASSVAAPDGPTTDTAAPPPRPSPAGGLAEPDELHEFDEESDDFDGSRLRWSRVRRGIEIEEIAGVTKISPTYLRFIEEERFSDLPAPVYIRGFVSAYATAVGLDPQRVTTSFMKRLAASRGRSTRR